MYSFERLSHTTIGEGSTVADIFEKSEKILVGNSNFVCIASLEELNKTLQEQQYFVMHDYVVRKGKKKIFKGKVVEASKDSILSYLGICKIENDCRPLRIISKNKNDVVYVDDEGNLYLYTREI